MRKMIMFIALCFLVFSCELFEAQHDPDFWQKLEDEIAWANATKLTVTLSAPGSWGQGSITTTAENRRQGYGFNVDFHPAQGYSILEWRAYNTDEIEAYRNANPDWNWLQAANPAEAFPSTKLKQLEGLKLNDNGKDIEQLSPNLPGGGTFVFKINVNKRVTLIPWCGNQPRIINTHPLIKDELISHRPTETIVIDLSSPVTSETVILHEGHIEIHTQALAANGEPDPEAVIVNASDFFIARWNAGLWRIIIEPKEDSLFMLEGRKITVTLGEGIQNALGESLLNLDENKKFSFSWKTGILSDIKVESLEAVYNETNREITIKWALDKSADVDVEIGYEINRGGRQSITNIDKEETSVIISNAQNLETAGVRSGRGVGNIQRYDIWIRLVDGDEGFRDREQITIWNIPGMKVTQDNTATAGNQSQLLEAINSGKVNIALANSFTVKDWEPCDLTDINFYGNGHTVTVNSFKDNGAGYSDIGLFGKAEKAFIRDLTVVYEDMTVSGASYVGGIAGQAVDTEILNCTVKGATSAATLTASAASGTQTIRLGGLVGYFEGDGIIKNCRAELSVAYATSSGHTGEVRIGGAVGETGEGTGTGNDRSISTNIGTTFLNIYVDNVSKSVGPIVDLTRLLIDGVTVTANVKADKGGNQGIMNIGGVIGYSGYNTMNDVEYTAGTISFSKTAVSAASTNNNYCGGITGNSIHTSIIDCHFSGTILPEYDVNGIGGVTNLGGLSGRIIGANNPSSAPTILQYINNNTVQGNIDLKCANEVFSGGVSGRSIIDSNVRSFTTNTFFNDGNITLNTSTSTSTIYAGGFTGTGSGTQQYFYNCGAKKGNLTITGGGNVWAGGFTTSTDTGASYCFSNMNITTTNSSTIVVGGFMESNNGTISNCYATGSITSTNNSTDSGNYINIGGLVGSNNGTIQNCYALGDVTATKSGASGNFYVGGLVGRLSTNSYSPTINNSFSKGQVTVSASSGAPAYAGGLVGYRDDDNNGIASITNSAALNPRVLVSTSSSTRGVGRIYGFPASAPSGTSINNNHALSTMAVGYGTTASHTPKTLVVGVTAPDGRTTAILDLTDSRFWIGTIGFNMENGLLVGNWNFARVGTEGHPRLAWE